MHKLNNININILQEEELATKRIHSNTFPRPSPFSGHSAHQKPRPTESRVESDISSKSKCRTDRSTEPKSIATFSTKVASSGLLPLRKVITSSTKCWPDSPRPNDLNWALKVWPFEICVTWTSVTLVKTKLPMLNVLPNGRRAFRFSVFPSWTSSESLLPFSFLETSSLLKAEVTSLTKSRSSERTSWTRWQICWEFRRLHSGKA